MLKKVFYQNIRYNIDLQKGAAIKSNIQDYIEGSRDLETFAEVRT